MARVSLGLRFGVAAVLLVCTTVIATVWTLVALSRLSGLVTDTVHDSESVTAVTSSLAGALEREDDAVLLVLAGDPRSQAVLASERTTVDKAVTQLFDVLGPADEQELARPLVAELEAYRRAADALTAVTSEREALVQYHQRANPLLRRAVALTTVIRDRHFELARNAVTGAKDQAASAQRIVLLITVVALAVAALVAGHLTSRVVGPLRRLTRGAIAIREGRFDDRIDLTSRDELGELADAFNSMATDLAEFRRTNIGEVLAAKTTLEATLAALPDAVVLLDAECRIRSMNPAAVVAFRAAGIDAPETLQALQVDGLDRDDIANAVRAVADIAPVSDLSRTIAVDRDGTTHRLLPRVVPVAGPTGERSGAILVLYDVTDLVRLDEMRSELVAVASHELQTPLTTLRMTLLMLQETSGALPARERELVATSLIGVEQLAETVHEFLDLTRIEAGELRLNLELVHVSSLMADVVERAEAQATALDIRVRLQMPDDVVMVRADRRRLRVVFDNLLSNALKYTPAGGSITIAAARTALDRVSISVTDTGPGVPVAFRSRIFDKFFRLEHHHLDERRHARGAGIGLYMCRQIVDLHGGRVTCDAGLDGHGARIVVELPVTVMAATMDDRVPV